MSCFKFEKLLNEIDVLNCLLKEDDDKMRNKMKSRVVTLFLRLLTSHMSLSKNQTNSMVDFFKKATVFISPGSEEVTKRIFSSYDSCRRQSLKEEARKHLLCKKYMNECMFFSIGIDTALFGNEHFIS